MFLHTLKSRFEVRKLQEWVTRLKKKKKGRRRECVYIDMPMRGLKVLKLILFFFWNSFRFMVKLSGKQSLV